MSSRKQSRRHFLQSSSLIGAGLPLVSLKGFGDVNGNIKEQEEDAGYPDGSIAVGKSHPDYFIRPVENGFDIKAGLLYRQLTLDEKSLTTKRLHITDKDILSSSREFTVTFHSAYPNQRPPGLILNKDGKEEWANGQETNGPADNQPVEWRKLATISGESMGSFFKPVSKSLSFPKKGVSRLQLRFQSFGNNSLNGVAINVYYEVYQGYPAIRKWIEIVNNGSQWLKIDQLVIDDIDIVPAFTIVTQLTPAEKGAESSIVSFSDTQYSTGIIACSEIPSAIRKIAANGAMGYMDDYFEWVLGPSESFESEPVSCFAFSGDNKKTISGNSTALDRAVEIPFKEFLRNCIGLRGSSSDVPAPIWCSYSNFLISLTDANMRQQADIAERIGFATFQLDEGWAKTPSPGGSEPGPTFPDFESTCEYIRSKGLKLGLWISCFRGTDSKDLKALPDGRSLPLFINTKRGYGMSFSGSWRDYFANDIVYMRDKYGMTYVKEDLTNISKGDIANSHESRTKKESLLRGLRGLLEVNKRIKELAPDVWTQVTHEIYWRTPGPAADIAVLKYACAFHTNPNTYLGAGKGSQRVSQDWDIDPMKMRAQLIESCWISRQRFFSHRGLPLYSVEFYAAHAVNIRGSLTPEVQDRQICSWLMGAPTVFAGDLSSLTEEHIEHYRKRFDLLKRLQHQYGIYKYFQYSGVPQPTDTDWHWWGKLDEAGSGVVVVIRGKEGSDSKAINIPWVKSHKKYRLAALLADKELGRFTGEQLQNGMLKMSLPANGQEIVELMPA